MSPIGLDHVPPTGDWREENQCEKSTLGQNKITFKKFVSPGHIGKPLCSQAGPLQSMGHHQIVKKRGVLFPYFVLFVDHTFFYCVIKGC